MCVPFHLSISFVHSAVVEEVHLSTPFQLLCSAIPGLHQLIEHVTLLRIILKGRVCYLLVAAGADCCQGRVEVCLNLHFYAVHSGCMIQWAGGLSRLFCVVQCSLTFVADEPDKYKNNKNKEGDREN